MRKGYTGLLVAVLAITAFVNPMAGPPVSGRSQSSSQAPPQSGAKKTARPASKHQSTPPLPPLPGLPTGFCQNDSERCPAKDLLDTIQGFFGADPKSNLIGHWNVPLGDRAGIRFVIATVPDPVHTRLPLAFDRQIDAIEEAAQESGYLFARASMPWDTKDHAEDTDYRLRLEQQDYQGLKESHPGLMIFRKVPRSADVKSSQGSSAQGASATSEARAARQSLFIFVVGETPTGGINKDQFNEAIQGIRDICSPKPECSPYSPTERLFILGPTFSGSLYSLKGLVQDAETGESGFSQAVVHSGTASDFRTIKWFEDSFPVAKGASPKVVFRAFQESSEYALVNFLRMTCDEKYRPEQVAVLSEDETAYGSAYTPELEPASEVCPRISGTKCQEPPKYSEADCVNEAKVVHLYFPRNISQLRSAYQQNLAASGASGASGSDAKNPSRTTLQTNLDENGSDDDTVAPYSQIQTPLSQEAIMLGIYSSLQRHGVRFVILEATNPVDSLFLIRFLRSANLQARIVTVVSDLLLTRQSDDPLLRGTMQITSYPLIPVIDDSEAKPYPRESKLHRHLVFPDSDSTGSFNALLSLLTVQERNRFLISACAFPDGGAQCVDLPAGNYAEYGWPSAAGPTPTLNADNRPLNDLAPSLWLTVLGRDGYWPIAILGAAGSTSTGPSLPAPQRLIHAVCSTTISLKCFSLSPPQGWILLCSLSIVLLIVYVITLTRGSIMSTSKFLVKFAPVCDGWRNFIFFAAGALLCLTMVAELWPWAYWTTGFGGIGYVWFAGLVVAVICFGILIVSAELWVRGAGFLASAMAIVCLSAFAGVFLAAGFLRQDPHPFFNLALYRYVNISSGTSPVIPFLLLIGAAFWWIWYWLTSRTLWLNDRFGYGPHLPTRRQVVLDADEDALKTAAVAGGVLTVGLENSGPVSRQSLDALTCDRNERLVNLIRKSTWDFRVLFPPSIAVVLSLAVVFPHPIQSFEGKLFDRLYWIFLTVALYGLLWALSKLIVIWLELRPLLAALDRLRLRRGFARMKGFTWRPLWGLGASALQDFFVNVSRELEALARIRNSQVSDPSFSREITASGETVRKLLQWMLQRSGRRGATETEVNNDVLSRLRSAYVRLRRKCGANESLESTSELVEQLATLQLRLASVAARALRYLQIEWAKETEDIEFEGKDLKGKDVRKEARKLLPATRYSEDFLCLFYFNFISSVFACMRTLVMRIAGIFVLVLLSFSSYPFEPRTSFHTLMIFLFVLVATVVSFVFAQMHKDSTLSRITDTTPGDLGFDFWLRLAAFVSVPLFSLLATAFPAVGNFLFSWLQPATQAFR